MTPLIHAIHLGELVSGHTHPGGDHQLGLGLVEAGDGEGTRGEAAHHTVDLDISTVAEGLLVSTAHPLCPILADTPGVASVVCPLHHTLTAGQTIGKVDLVLEPGDLGRVQRHIELVRGGIVCQHERVLVKTLLSRILILA